MSSVIDKVILKKGERVQAAQNLPRVAQGTWGKVIFVEGISWIRYWVLFENGERVGTLSRAKLTSAADLERPVVIEGAKAEKETAGDLGKGASSGSTEGIPNYLIERSAAARARLGKPK